MVKPYIPERGDIIWINMSPQAGHEQSGRRPAVVLSPSTYNARAGLALMCPITSRVKGYPFEVTLPPDLPAGGVVLSDQIRSLDWRQRQAEFIATLPMSVIEDVLARVRALIV